MARKKKRTNGATTGSSTAVIVHDAGRRGKKKSRNPGGDGKPIWPWLVGLAGAGLLGYGAWRAFSGPGQPEQPQPAPTQPGSAAPADLAARMAAWRAQYQPQQVTPGTPMAGMSGMFENGVAELMARGHDEHGIPVVALPGESATRTMQARRHLAALERQMFQEAWQQAYPQQPPPNGYGVQPQQAMVPQGAIPIESFGGGESGASSLGGEGF